MTTYNGNCNILIGKVTISCSEPVPPELSFENHVATAAELAFINNRGIDVSIFSYGSTGNGVPGNIHHIDVINNYFRTISNYCIKVLSASDINVRDNLMYATNKGDNYFMRVDNSKDCGFIHNKYITTHGHKKGHRRILPR